MKEASLPSTVVSDELSAVPQSGAMPQIIAEDPGGAADVQRSETEREIAFQAAPFVWQGRTLIPFAIDREGDWLVHRTLINAAPLATVFSVGQAFLPDACRILWFCSHEPEEWLERSADFSPQQDSAGVRAWALEQRIRAWAVQNIPTGSQSDAVTLAFKIYNRVHANRAIAKPEPKGKGTDPGNSPGL